MRSLIGRLISFCIRLSMNSSRITPPSRMGMGSRFMMPRFKLMAAVIRSSGRPALFAGRLADVAADADGAVNLTHGNFVLHHLLQQLQNQERILLVFRQGLLHRFRKIKLHNFGRNAGDADAIRRFLPGLSERVEHRLHREGLFLAIAENAQHQRLILGVVQHLDQRSARWECPGRWR